MKGREPNCEILAAMQASDDTEMDWGRASSLNFSPEFWPLLSNCLFDVSAQMSNKHLKPCMYKTKLPICLLQACLIPRLPFSVFGSSMLPVAQDKTLELPLIFLFSTPCLTNHKIPSPVPSSPSLLLPSWSKPL